MVDVYPSTVQEASPSRGFSAFAGNMSSFGSAELNNTFRSTAGRPVWRSVDSTQDRALFGGHVSPNETVFQSAIRGTREDEAGEKASEGDSKASLSKSSSNPLAAEIPSRTTYTRE
jgi:hypothetical protein